MWIEIFPGSLYTTWFLKNHWFWAVLGLHCYAWAFFSCCKRGLPFHVVCGLLIVAASLGSEHERQSAWGSAVAAYGLSSCGSKATERRLSSCGTLDPRPGLELVSPALQGGLPIPGPRKPLPCNFGLYPRFLTIMTRYLALMESIDIFVLVGSQSG